LVSRINANSGSGSLTSGGNLSLSNNATSNTVLSIANSNVVVYSSNYTSNVVSPFTATFVDSNVPSTHAAVSSSTDKYMIFTTAGVNHTFTVPNEGLNCDILMIGGGGAGNGGNGAGACIVAINQTLPVGSCVVNVGAGSITASSVNGGDSFIQVGGVDRYRAKGGGSSSTSYNMVGNSGGCGAGATYNTDIPTAAGGAAVNTNVVNGVIENTPPRITSTYAVLGNAGGNNGSVNNYTTGSGGGIGAAGTTAGTGGNGAYQVTLTGAATPINFRSYFANGSTSFGVQDGTTTNYYIGGGGYNGSIWAIGGLGGGGRGGVNGRSDAISNTGSGGSGGTNGGSGIIIIRYRTATSTTPTPTSTTLTTLGTPSIELIRGIAGDNNLDYKLGNYEGNFKIMSSISNTDTDRLSITSSGNINITGTYNINNRNVINDTSNYILATSNLLTARIQDTSNALVSRIDTKQNTINSTANQIIIGNGNGSITTNASLTFTNNDTLNAPKFVGNGSGLTNLPVSSQWAGTTSLTFAGNVGIGTTTNINNKLVLYNDSTGATSLTINNNGNAIIGFTSATTISPTGTGTFVTGQITSSIDKFMIFTAGTSSFTVPTGGINCDILMIGGGGYGRYGGGGAGACIVAIIQTLPTGSYNVYVGNGSEDSYITLTVSGTTTTIYLAKAGGYGGFLDDSGNLYGGCGGGGGYWNNSGSEDGGVAVSTNIVNGIADIGPSVTSTYAVFGNKGGGQYERRWFPASGGGGIGTAGVDHYAGNSNGTAGGDGLFQATIGGTTYNFRSHFANGGNNFGVLNSGDSQYYIGGGGGGRGGYGSNGSAGKGSGGANTGSGGAGEGNGNGAGGSSGIVIIRYRLATTSIGNPTIELIRGTTGDTNRDYKLGNYNGDFLVKSSINGSDNNYSFKIIGTDGTIYNQNNSLNWNQTSDRRIKENIEQASYDKCYENISRLELNRFNYIKEFNNYNKDTRQLGFIAQEIKEIFPKAIYVNSYNNDTLSIPDLLSIDITQINYTLYGAVKKLMEINKDKELRIKNIEKILNIVSNTSNVIIDNI